MLKKKIIFTLCFLMITNICLGNVNYLRKDFAEWISVIKNFDQLRKKRETFWLKLLRADLYEAVQEKRIGLVKELLDGGARDYCSGDHIQSRFLQKEPCQSPSDKATELNFTAIAELIKEHEEELIIDEINLLFELSDNPEEELQFLCNEYGNAKWFERRYAEFEREKKHPIALCGNGLKGKSYRFSLFLFKTEKPIFMRMLKLITGASDIASAEKSFEPKK